MDFLRICGILVVKFRQINPFGSTGTLSMSTLALPIEMVITGPHAWISVAF
jgi:hypothetical protein